MTDAKPWYRSRTVWGGIVAIAASVAGLAGTPVDAGQQALLTEAILQAVTAAGALVAILGRFAANSRIF